MMLAASLLSVTSIAQNDETPVRKGNMFYISPFELFLNTLQVGCEKKLKNHNTLALMGGFTLAKKNEVISDIGGSGEIQYRMNLLYNKRSINIVSSQYSTFVYFAPFANYRYVEKTDVVLAEAIQASNNITYINSLFGGFVFGGRFSGVENRFCLNVFLGGGLKYSVVEGQKEYTEFLRPGYTGIAPKAGFQLGIAL